MKIRNLDDRGLSRWLVWLHRLGYITTVLIALQLVAFGYFSTKQWFARRHIYAQAIEESRTHETALFPSDDLSTRSIILQSLAGLPPLKSLNGEGLRFVALPSFGMETYAVALSLPRNAQAAVGTLLVTETQAKGVAKRQRRFQMPASAYRSFVADLDRQTDGWPGDASMCLDGTVIAFERIRGSRITSGSGNCSPHYHALRAVVLRILHRFAPGADLPSSDDWMRTESEQNSGSGK